MGLLAEWWTGWSVTFALVMAQFQQVLKHMPDFKHTGLKIYGLAGIYFGALWPVLGIALSGDGVTYDQRLLMD